MIGEPRNFPFDEYLASIGTQNDYKVGNTIEGEIPIRFEIQNHLKDFFVQVESGGDHAAIITLSRTNLNKLLPFIPLLILSIYISWCTYSLFWRRRLDGTNSIVSNIALLLGILSLRAFVVPNGIPFGCTFDWALMVPIIIILASVIRIIQLQLRQP